MKDAQVLVVGSYVQDHSWLVDRFAAPGETRRANSFHTGPGGKGFNQAVACARQGVATAFIGAIGKDPLGENAQRFANEESLACRWQLRVGQPTAAASILVNAQGENQIAVALGANQHLAPEFVCAQGDLFTCAQILLVQMENNLDAIAAALSLSKTHGMTRILNPAPVHPQLQAALLGSVDILTPNETEFAQLRERIGAAPVEASALATLADDRLHALCRDLSAATVVITLGAQGCFVSHPDVGDRRGDAATYYRVAAERVQAVDTTGAGDAFSGSLAAALVLFDKAPFSQAVAYAGRVAALSTETVGAAPAMPTRDRVLARFPS